MVVVRDMMFAFACLMMVPLAFVRPITAYFMWGWTAVLIPTSYLYGFMADARINLLFAVLTLLLIILGRVPLRDYQKNRVTWLYLLFFIQATLSFVFAYGGNPDNAKYYEILAKVMVFSLLMPIFVNSRLRLHMMVLVVVLGLGLHGVLDGLKTLASAGSHNMYGPSSSMIADRNHLSTALAMVLPLIYYLSIYSSVRFIRIGFLSAFGLVALAIMGGGSRGGFLALAIVGVWLVMTSRYKFSALLLVATLATAFYIYAPDDWTSRLSTIQTANEDSSFMGRVVAWKVSSALALDHPFLGGGFHAVQVQYIWDMFKGSPGLLGFLDIPIPEFNAKAAHSIYFEVLGDLGFLGLLVFVFILFQAIYTRFQIKRMVNELGGRAVWASDLADMLMLSVIAYMVGGAGVSLAYFEAIYIVIMLMELLRVHVVAVRRQIVVS